MVYSEFEVIKAFFVAKLPNVTVFVMEQWRPHNGEKPLYRVSLVDLNAVPTCCAGESQNLWEAVYMALAEWTQEHRTNATS